MWPLRLPPRRARREAPPPAGLLSPGEESRRQADAHDLQLLAEPGPYAGRVEIALDLAIGDAGLLEGEHVLEHDHFTFHALHLGDGGDLARAILEPLSVDD